MDTINPEQPPLLDAPAPPPVPSVWKFWGTLLWGLGLCAAMFAGQTAVIACFVLRGGIPTDIAAAIDAVTRVVTDNGLAISLSVIAGLPAIAAVAWLAIRFTHIGFADYLALRWSSWWNLVIGVVGLAVLAKGWDFLARASGHTVTPDFMTDVLKSAERDHGIWLLAFALCVAAPLTEEIFARGFLYRGWSESVIRVPGAILLSSAAWTILHVQYDWFFLAEVFSIGAWFGYMRYRSNSLLITTVLHGLNNLAALVQTMWLAGHV
jgi:membrane protease YdiL (CAAX protease family)